MLKCSDLPKKLSPYAAKYATHIRNSFPCSALKFISPIERATGISVNHNTRPAFGSVVYPHVNAKLQTKLDDTANIAHFMGYNVSSTGLLAYVSTMQTMVASYHHTIHDQLPGDENTRTTHPISQHTFEFPNLSPNFQSNHRSEESACSSEDGRHSPSPIAMAESTMDAA